MEKKIFVSVGKTSTKAQEEFVDAIETRIRAEGFIPCTVGRNTWTSGAPLAKVVDLMAECAGVVIIALERTYYPAGIERRGHEEESKLAEVRLPTPFNQVEAAMAYVHCHPLLVIVEKGLRYEGLLETGNDWFVQRLEPKPEALNTTQFNGVFASWKEQVLNLHAKGRRVKTVPNPSEMTVAQLVGALKPAQLWGLVATIAFLLAGAFSLGAKLFGAR